MKTLRTLGLVVLSWLMAAGSMGGGSLATVSAATPNTTTVAYSAIVHGQPEDVQLSGSVVISTVMVRDLDFGRPPKVIVSIDFSGVTGQGVGSKAKYVAGGNQVLTRPLVNPDVIRVVFPFYARGTNGTTGARSAEATFTLNYDLVTGSPTGASATTTADLALPAL